MNIFLTKDRTNYRRWINFLLSLLLPGSAQYLSGRKVAGVLWFLFLLLMQGMLSSYEFLYDSPSTFWTTIAKLFIVLQLIDACRCSIQKMRIKRWGTTLGSYLLLIILIPVCSALIIRQFFVQPFTVPTGAMQPTIMGITTGADGNQLSGDQIIVNKTAYWRNPPQRGDIVVFKTKGIDHPNVRSSVTYLKRIVGLPGETVSIHPPEILINGKLITEPEILVTISSGQKGYHGYTLAHDGSDAILTTPAKSITLGDDEYFVMGDNSERSLDSRYFGPIKRSSILGKVVYRHSPPHRKGRVQ